MSGLGAPARTESPRPARTNGVTVPATTLPVLTRSSIGPGFPVMRSAVPSLSLCCRTASSAWTTVTLCPLARGREFSYAGRRALVGQDDEVGRHGRSRRDRSQRSQNARCSDFRATSHRLPPIPRSSIRRSSAVAQVFRTIWRSEFIPRLCTKNLGRAPAAQPPEPKIPPTLVPSYVVDLMTAEGIGAFEGRWKTMEAKIVEGPALPNAMPGYKTSYDITPHAGEAGFDDSSWPAIEAKGLTDRRGGGKVSF